MCGIIVKRFLRYHHRYDFLVLSANANEIVTSVMALEEAELLCTVVLDTGTTVTTPPQGPLQMK